MDQSQNILSDIVIFNKYAKYLPDLKRRETWQEIVNRYVAMMIEKYPNLTSEIISNSKFIVDKKVLPSMRALQFAGEAIRKNHSRIYNCAYLPINHYAAFSETMFLLLGGTGVGYSIQKHHVIRLPVITKPEKQKKFLIGDSIEGWADAVKALMKSYFGLTNYKPRFDFSDIRPKGARLVTAGGKAPGPEPLKVCLFLLETILEGKQNGEKLTPLECNDILCHIANAVLAGGIRRAAMIALFSLDDEEMISCKSSNIPSKILSKEHPKYTSKDGLQEDTTKLILTVQQNEIIYKDVIIYIDVKTGKFWDIEQYELDRALGWWVCNEQRGRANNSVILERDKVTEEKFLNIWKKIEDSNAGEPGTYFTNDVEMGTNPCAEIALESFQFCNLTEVNVSNIESQKDLNERVRIAAFFGTLQAGFTDFHYLRDIWRKTTEKDALIGVGMTGIGSGVILNYNLSEAVDTSVKENERVAQLIDINPGARVTTIKPSGTSSLVLGTSSGIHAWHSDYYIRRMRLGKNEALYHYLTEHLPQLLEDDAFKPSIQSILSIPQKASDNAILRSETALKLLERVKKFNLEWVRKGHRSGSNTNNVSATISIDKGRFYDDEKSGAVKDEWEVVGEWMWNNRNTFNGLSVLPVDNGSYVQAPFENCTKEKFEELSKHLHNIDLTKVMEEEDITAHNQEAACAGGACEVV